MGQDQLSIDGSCAASPLAFPARICLRKGCAAAYDPRRWNQRFCQQPECQRLVRRWQAAKRQRDRRSRPEVREARAAAARQQRAECAARRCASAECVAEVPAEPATPAAWSRSKPLPEDFCDRPGCYEPCQTVGARPTRYCGEACREVLRRARDRERKYLARKTQAGRFKCRLEYQARARRNRAILRCEQSAAIDHRDPTVGASWESGTPSLSSPGIQEDSAHDSQGSACSRSRAPPTS